MPPVQTPEVKIGMLYYVAGEETIFAVVLDCNGKCQRFELFRWEEAFPLIDALTDAIDGSYAPRYKHAQIERFASDWGRRLLPPSGALKPYDVLVVVPHHSLHRLPFHVVRLDEEEGPLGACYGMTYCSSGTLFVHAVSHNAARHAQESRPTKCVAIAEDVLHDRAAAYEALARSFSGFFEEFDLDPVLSRLSVKQPHSDVLCVVCHGYYDDIEPSNCGLLLNNGIGWGSGVERPITFGNGGVGNFRDLPFHFPPLNIDAHPKYLPEFLTVEELKVEAQCDAQLVALLGCATAAASPASLDEPGSLAEQWLRHGAATVLANLWECDAIVASEWCHHFLTNWIQQRMPKAMAWAAANRELLTADPTLTAFDWGTFTLWGDWL